MRKSNALVDQVTSSGLIISEQDQILSVSEIRTFLLSCFPNLEVVKTTSGIVYLGHYNGKSFSIRCKNISYLGYPHPAFKKRIQISDDLQSFYSYSRSIGATPLLLGIYSHDETLVFCSFSIDTYINNKAHNSSAHVYSTDLAEAVRRGIFEKNDAFGNTITVFNKDHCIDFLNHALRLIESDIRPQIIQMLDSFFVSLPRMWEGTSAYCEMVNAHYNNAYQAEWPGFYLEYLFDLFLHKTKTGFFRYEQDKRKDGIDLDLYFPDLKTYGDLKCHSIESDGIQGNDADTIYRIINDQSEFRSVYYVVLEHNTERDRDHNFIVTEYWNRLLGKSNIHSYGNRMKYSIEPLRYYVLDINRNTEKYLTQFNQGVNSNGLPRKPKIMIKNKDIDPFLLHSKKLSD